MTDEEIIQELTERGMRTALLLGEITGRLHVIINDVHEAVYSDKLHRELTELWNEIIYKVNEIYYNNKEENHE